MKKGNEKYSSYAEINMKNLVHNYEIASKKVGANSKVLAVVKADAYNHGAEMISKKLYLCGARHFAVANIDEALLLRSQGVGGMILVLGPMLPSRYKDVAENDISLTIESFDSLAELNKFSDTTEKSIKVHIALNTGMNRIGFCAYENCLSDELLKVADVLKSNKKIIPEGVFSHLCDCDNDDTTFTELQFERFQKTINFMEKNGIKFQINHISNSMGTFKFPKFHCDLVRVGIGLYGCELSDEGFLPVLSFKTHIAQILTVKKGEGIGYGRSFIADKDMKIATITAGYADGFNRLLSNKGSVLIKGKRAKIVGRICMDMSMVDISDIPEVTLYDEVTIIGTDGNQTITAEEQAELCGTISYEILCGIGKRVNREYIDN